MGSALGMRKGEAEKLSLKCAIKIADRLFQPLLQQNFRLPTQLLTGQRDVRLTLFGIIRWQGF